MLLTACRLLPLIVLIVIFPPPVLFPTPLSPPRRTRLFNQDPRHKLYSGPLDCVRKMLASEGPRGFFKGYAAHFARLGPHTVLTFTVWEQLKALYAQRNAES